MMDVKLAAMVAKRLRLATFQITSPASAPNAMTRPVSQKLIPTSSPTSTPEMSTTPRLFTFAYISMKMMPNGMAWMPSVKHQPMGVEPAIMPMLKYTTSSSTVSTAMVTKSRTFRRSLRAPGRFPAGTASVSGMACACPAFCCMAFPFKC